MNESAASWRLARLGDIADVRQGRSPSQGDYLNEGKCKVIKVRDIDESGRVVWTIDKAGRVGCDRVAHSTIAPGDTLILAAAHSSKIVGTKIGFVSNVPDVFEKVVHVAELIRVRPIDTVHPLFLHFLFFLPSIAEQVRGAVKGGHLYARDLADLSLSIPPVEVQTAIANGLKLIQQSVAATRRERDLEMERLAALIDHLFSFGTRGTQRSSTPVGEAPTNWRIAKLGELCRIVRGASPRPKGDPRYYGGSIPRLMIADVTRDGMYVTPKIDYLTEAGARLSRPMLKGDLVLSISGTVALPCFLAVDACIHDGFIGLKDIAADLLPSCLYFELLFWRERLNEIAPMGSIFKNLTTDIVRDFNVLIPPADEQREISGILLGCQSRMALLEHEITLLDELFDAMLEELMTGRLSAAPLMEEAIA